MFLLTNIGISQICPNKFEKCYFEVKKKKKAKKKKTKKKTKKKKKKKTVFVHINNFRPSQGFWGFREKDNLFSGIWGEG